VGATVTAVGSFGTRPDVNGEWADRHVLVTGATGIVGSWLCKDLLERGASVTAFVRDDDPQSEFFRSETAGRCGVVRGDLATFTDCLRAINLSESDVVFHLGAQTIVGAALREPLETFESNVRGTYNLLEAARRLPGLARTIVVASSDKAYGDADGLPYDEDMPLRGRHPYDVSKSCADLLATTYAHTYGLNVTIARCGNIYGGGDLNWSRIVPGTIRSLLRGERPVLRSSGRLVRDYIYVRDVVAGYIALAAASESAQLAGEAFNFSPESRVTVLEIVESIATIMHAPCDPNILDTARFEIAEQTLNSAKARRMLHWQPTWTLEAGLTETVDWYREHLGAGMTGTPAHAFR
jgi:CDP-glucose 4,6-dehydratase